MSLFSLVGISSALAEATETASPGAGQGANFLHMLPMLIIFIVVFYFLLIRPQTKRSKDHKKLMGSISEGDEVMTAGGIMGRVKAMKDNYVVLTVSKGVEITLQKGSIASVLPKGTMDSVE